jgi:hypothetical protein
VGNRREPGVEERKEKRARKEKEAKRSGRGPTPALQST